MRDTCGNLSYYSTASIN